MFSDTYKALLSVFSVLLLTQSTEAAEATGTIDAQPMLSFSISNNRSPDFGTFAAGDTAGTVVLHTDDTRSATGGVDLVTGGTFGVPVLRANGTGNFAFSVTYPESFTVSNGSDTMTVDEFDALTSGTLAAGGFLSWFYGLTLHVNANQPTGEYTGSYLITAFYD